MTPDAVLLVPVKQLTLAKSRLRDGSVGDVEGLVLAMTCDVVAAGMAAERVARVVVISNDVLVRRAAGDLGATVVADRPALGLNDSIKATIADLGMGGPAEGPIMCQPADCPCITADEISALVDRAHTLRRHVFVSDTEGAGTTSLLSHRAAMDPRYGPDSAAAHRAAGFLELRGPRWQRIGRDVDTPQDLLAALRLGAGAHTSAWAARTKFASV